MPFVVNCPTCRKPLSVHESQAGTVVPCPHCRQRLTAPGLPPAVVPSPASSFANLENDNENSERISRSGYNRATWPGEPSGWLIAARTVIWGVIAIP